MLKRIIQLPKPFWEKRSPQMLVSESTKGNKSTPQARGPRSKETRNFPRWRRSVKDLTCRQSPLKMFTLPFSPLPPRVPFLAGNHSVCVTVMNLKVFWLFIFFLFIIHVKICHQIFLFFLFLKIFHFIIEI